MRNGLPNQVVVNRVVAFYGASSGRICAAIADTVAVLPFSSKTTIAHRRDGASAEPGTKQFGSCR